jgi:acyl-CoA thioesterase I
VKSVVIWGLVAGLAVAGACRRDAEPAAPLASVVGRSTPPPDAPSRVGARPKVVVLGDSIAAGLGLPVADAFPARLQEKLDAQSLNYEVVAAGVSGETSAGGVRRLDWVLGGDVRVLVIELGANDGLRGLPIAAMRRNLGTIIDRAQARGIAVILCGMEAPPNFGAAYTDEFREAYRSLAAEKRVTFVPFVLEGVAGLPEMNQADGIHPNAAGARRVAETIWPALAPIVAAS